MFQPTHPVPISSGQTLICYSAHHVPYFHLKSLFNYLIPILNNLMICHNYHLIYTNDLTMDQNNLIWVRNVRVYPGFIQNSVKAVK